MTAFDVYLVVGAATAAVGAGAGALLAVVCYLSGEPFTRCEARRVLGAFVVAATSFAWPVWLTVWVWWLYGVARR